MVVTLLPEAVHASEKDQVLDMKGSGLLPGIPYYLITSQWPLGGGAVSLGKGVNETCPVDVILLENLSAKVEDDVNTIFRVVNVGDPYGSYYKLGAYKFSSYGLLLSTSDVGVEFNFITGIRRLALTEPPFIVSFEVALDYEAGLKEMV
ncbi:unnamed protein product [Dovyalis caffra]|uniref:Uncharacterized protein n=1 Tax=Dovyalis caffra TaxID=77055 RepID=A0AAV1QSD6_9ROSI|nr:unnamed protein product [Dovyalis caffra]